MSYNHAQLLSQSQGLHNPDLVIPPKEGAYSPPPLNKGLPAGLLNPVLAKPVANAVPVEPPPFDPGMYNNAYTRLGMLSINNVAELGCGAGNFVSIMSRRKMKPEMYVGIDQSHKDISVAKAAYPDWKFIYGDICDQRIRAEYERFDAYLMLNLLETLEDDLGFLRTLPSEKPLVFSVPFSPQPGAVRFMTDSHAIREYYSDILRIKTIGRYNNRKGESWGMVIACRW